MNTIKYPVGSAYVSLGRASVVDSIGNLICDGPSAHIDTIVEALNKEAAHDDEMDKLREDRNEWQSVARDHEKEAEEADRECHLLRARIVKLEAKK